MTLNIDTSHSFFLVPAEEVVSIYGPDFDINFKKSQEPYFIKINRCITITDTNKYDPEIHRLNISTSCWSVPKSQASRQEIEIVVPDLNEKKFYKYIVFNDSACKCGNKYHKQHKNMTGKHESKYWAIALIKKNFVFIKLL